MRGNVATNEIEIDIDFLCRLDTSLAVTLEDMDPLNELRESKGTVLLLPYLPLIRYIDFGGI
jgi:hypothetical protein